MSIPSHQSGRRPEKIHALTSLRFFAALFVVIYHTIWTTPPAINSAKVIDRIGSLGFLSVGFFFLLSGYILAMVYLSPGNQVSNGSFFAARFARIYPLYLLTLIVDTPWFILQVVKEHGHGHISTGRRVAEVLATNLFMLQAWFPSLRGIDNPNWSLSVEAVFYLLFPFIGVWLWRLRDRAIWITAVGLWISSQIVIYLITPHLGDNVRRFNPVLHLCTFALGILLARWQVTERERHGQSPKHTVSVAISLLLALSGYVALIHWLPKIRIGNVHDGLMAPVFMCIIWAFSANERWPARLLSVRWLVILGEASYGLYLIHIPVFHLFQSSGLQSIAMLYPLYVCLCVGLSVLSFYWIETPSRKWILHKLHTRPKETMEMASDAQ